MARRPASPPPRVEVLVDRSVCYLAAEQRRCFGGAMAEDLRARVQALAGGFDLVALRCRVQADIDALRQKGMLK